MIRAWFLLTLGTAVLAGTPLRAQTVTYELGEASFFVEGCFPPCHCPLFFGDDLSGTFELVFLGGTPDGFAHYGIRNVDWTLAYPGGAVQRVIGSGTYDRGGEVVLMQRLQLDLSIDGGGVEQFDSGLVVGGYSFPVIEASVNLNRLVCFDRVFTLDAAPVSFGDSFCTSNPNSTGQGATIRAVGSAVVADNELTLIAQATPEGVPGLFFFGADETELPFGDGFLCVTGALNRIPPALTTAPDGNALRTVDLAAPPAAGHLLAGSTWSFQFWFRDVAGGPAGFNLTDGVTVTFQ